MAVFDRLVDWLDDRLGLTDSRAALGKAFPVADSFLLGEIALFNFLVLVLTGLFLGFFYEPSTAEVTYQGSVLRYQDETVPEAFASVLRITYDIPYGMFVRRMHHWAAHLFVAAIALHMLRVFFTGAYRNPREPNWLVGTTLAALSMFASYTGYALPFDEFATTATGIGHSIARSVPIVGDALAGVVFGGTFPSGATIPRLYFLHVLVLPTAIALLIGLHLAILVRQKHTELPRQREIAGPEPVDRDDDSVLVGLPAVPNQAAISIVVCCLLLAVLSLLAGLLPVHNVAAYGPNDPTSTPSPIMPDWFLMWGYGFLKLVPSWLQVELFGITISTEFIGGALLPGLVFGLVLLWPFVDTVPEPVHFTADPLDRPWQTAAGIAGVVFVMVASVAGMDVFVADLLGTTTAALTPALAGLLVFGPLLAGAGTYLLLTRLGDETEPGSVSTADDRSDSAGGHTGEATDGGHADASSPTEHTDEQSQHD
jgi:cytochrome b-561